MASNIWGDFLDNYSSDIIDKMIKEQLNNDTDAMISSAFDAVNSGDVPSTVMSTSDASQFDWTNIENGIINTEYVTSNPTINADDITIDGKSLSQTINKMQERLAILDDPTPEKLEKFEALKKAYEQYKLLEKLCFEKGDKE